MAVLITPAGLARTATPVAGERTFQERFTELAVFAPDWMQRDDVTILYADLEWRAEFVGVDLAESVDGIIDYRVGIGMAVPPAYMFAAYFPKLGFTSSQVTRTLTLDAIRDKITLMQGEFDFAEMDVALVERGYVRETLAGYPVYVFGGDDHNDPTSEVGGLALSGKTQYLIVLDDGLLAFTNKRLFAEQVVATHAGEQSGLADHADVQALVGSARTDLVSAQIWSVQALGLESNATVHAGGENGAVMPRFRWMLLGDSVGTALITGDVRIERAADAAGTIILLLDNDDQVETVLSLVPARFNETTSLITNVPYTNMLTLLSAEPGASVGAAVFEFDIPIIGRLSQMWIARDLEFIYPG